MLYRKPCETFLAISQWKVDQPALCSPLTLHPSARGLWAVGRKWSISSVTFLHPRMENPETARGRERDGQEVASARTELGSSGINSIFSLGCITNCWAREESKCGLVGSKINSLEIKSLMASWELATLRKPERAFTEEGIALCPSKRTGNTHCLPFCLTHTRKKKET